MDGIDWVWTWTAFQTECQMPNAQCPMPNAQCPMPNAQCPLPTAHCPMPNGQMPNAPTPNAKWANAKWANAKWANAKCQCQIPCTRVAESNFNGRANQPLSLNQTNHDHEEIQNCQLTDTIPTRPHTAQSNFTLLIRIIFVGVYPTTINPFKNSVVVPYVFSENLPHHIQPIQQYRSYPISF